MKRTLAVVVVVAGVLVGCGGDDSEEPANASGASEQATTEQQAERDTAAPAARRRGPLVRLRDSQFGPVMFDGRARALYLFTRDGKNRSRCYGDCAVAWPPFLAKGRPRAGRGVDQSLLGTIRRRNGSRQVTYKGQPLYFYVDDPRGQVLCNNVVEFGGTWYALDAEGNPPT